MAQWLESIGSNAAHVKRVLIDLKDPETRTRRTESLELLRVLWSQNLMNLEISFVLTHTPGMIDTSILRLDRFDTECMAQVFSSLKDRSSLGLSFFMNLGRTLKSVHIETILRSRLFIGIGNHSDTEARCQYVFKFYQCGKFYNLISEPVSITLSSRKRPGQSDCKLGWYVPERTVRISSLEKLFRTSNVGPPLLNMIATSIKPVNQDMSRCATHCLSLCTLAAANRSLRRVVASRHCPYTARLRDCPMQFMLSEQRMKELFLIAREERENMTGPQIKAV
jgi:hypothetical protein